MKNVLLAEPHPPTREHLRAALDQAGFTVLDTGEVGQAHELLSAERIDLLVVAVDLPRLDGVHLLQALRQSTAHRDLPVVVIDKGHLGKARGVGAVLDLRPDAYVADPVRGNELVARIRGLRHIAERRDPATETGLKATLSRPPVAAGELKGLPLPWLVHSFFRLRRDGVLLVAHRDLTRRVYFLAGAAVGYDSTARQDAIAQFLVEHGLATANQADQLELSRAKGLRVGAALAEAGVALAGEELLAQLREYTRERVAQVIGMREGRYGFYAGNEFAPRLTPIEVPALAPLLEGARRAFPVKVFAQALREHRREFPYRTPEFGRDLAALGLDTQDLKLAMQLNGRIPLEDLLAHGRGDLRSSYSLAWLLHLTAHIAFSRAPVASGDAGNYTAHERIAPRRRKVLPANIAAELRESAVKILTSSYFRALGLDITADTEAVESAYHREATRFHPDSYSDYDTSELKDLLESVQDRLSASYRVLSVNEKRKAYLQYLLSRLDIRRVAGVHVEAEIALKRGEAALKRRDFVGAQKSFEQAVELNPREPEYYCHLAWASYLAAKGSAAERARPAQKLLRKALGLNPYLERASIITAILEGEAGDTAAARKRLLKVLEMNPRSQLAKAALRKVGR